MNRKQGVLPSQFDSISHFGPLARTVEDAALFLGVTQGPDECDIQSLKPILHLVLPLNPDLRGMRIALSIDLGYFRIAPEVEARTRSAADALRDAGAVVEEVDLGWTSEIHDTWLLHWGVYLAAFLGQHLGEWRDKMDPNLVELMEEGFAMGAVDFKRIEFVRTRQMADPGPNPREVRCAPVPHDEPDRTRSRACRDRFRDRRRRGAILGP